MPKLSFAMLVLAIVTLVLGDLKKTNEIVISFIFLLFDQAKTSGLRKFGSSKIEYRSN